MMAGQKRSSSRVGDRVYKSEQPRRDTYHLPPGSQVNPTKLGGYKAVVRRRRVRIAGGATSVGPPARAGRLVERSCESSRGPSSRSRLRAAQPTDVRTWRSA